MKAMQFEMKRNLETLNEKTPSMDAEIMRHPSRHQKVIKQHIIRLEKNTQALHKENFFLKTKMLAMGDQIRLLTEKLSENKEDKDNQEFISYNTILPQTENSDRKIMNLTEQLDRHNNSIANLTKQMANLDKLHLSMLELLENLETIENKVDKSFPEFRKEISKLEIQVAETSSANALVKEDQKNVIESLKAITFTVSTMQDKTTEDHKTLADLKATIDNLVKSTTLQTSKLHDHILKVSRRATKSCV